MLTSKQRIQISELLSHHDLLIDKLPPPRPNDYRELKDYVMMMELKESVGRLFQLLTFPESFSIQFQSHCQDRAIRNKNTLLDFSVTPSSVVNQLYWDIARIVTGATKLKDLMQVLLPHVTSVMSLEIPDSLPPNSTRVELKKAMKTIVAHPIIKPLKEFDAEIPSVGLEDFVISNQIIFDVRDLSRFPYHWQESLYYALHQNFPEIAKKLYSHNYALFSLKHDIELLSHSGKSPYALRDPLIIYHPKIQTPS